MKLYKLTKRNKTTHNGKMSWMVGRSNEVKKCKNPQLCSKDVIHAYKDKNLALLLNPIHANIIEPIIFEAEGNVVVENWDKVGVFKLKIIKKLNYPEWYTSNYKNDVLTWFAILCAESVLNIWEKDNQNDKRPLKAIEAAKNYLKNKTDADVAARAAHAATRAATRAAARDTFAAAAYAATFAARAAARDTFAAAAYAAHAAHAAACAADAKINFSKLAKQAIKLAKME